ncbi:hypothetical protein ABKN59_010328 [Abortiporus biennis]
MNTFLDRDSFEEIHTVHRHSLRHKFLDSPTISAGQFECQYPYISLGFAVFNETLVFLSNSCNRGLQMRHAISSTNWTRKSNHGNSNCHKCRRERCLATSWFCFEIRRVLLTNL